MRRPPRGASAISTRSETPVPAEPAAVAYPIAIWQPVETTDGVVFRRPPPGPLHDHYCDRLEIPRSSPRRRLCWFGESAAAGYLLAPDETPARALQRRLGVDWDVVDLARTNERLESLLASVRAAGQLDPEVLAVYWGNNADLLEQPEISPYFPAGAARREFGEALCSGGLLEPARRARERLEQRVRRVFAEVAALGTPTVLVIPEVNLADWSSDQPVCWLPGCGVDEWWRAHDECVDALNQGRPRAAVALAERMVELDAGICPRSFELLARALERFGDAQNRERAELARRAAVDVSHHALHVTLEAPRATPSTQDLLREVGAEHGWTVVDLPVELRRRAADTPGRRWFYDYCHLTPEGIAVLAAAVAGAVDGRVLRDPDDRVDGEVGGVPRQDVEAGLGARSVATLSASARALAELGAAVHGVHRGASGEIVRHWLRTALDTWPGVRDVLLDLCAARIAGIEPVFGRLREIHLDLQQGWAWPHLDAELLAAVEEVLRAPLHDLLEGHPALGSPSRVELWNPLDRCWAEVLPTAQALPRLAFQAFTPRTGLALWISPGDLVDSSRSGSEPHPEPHLELRLLVRVPRTGSGRAKETFGRPSESPAVSHAVRLRMRSGDRQDVEVGSAEFGVVELAVSARWTAVRLPLEGAHPGLHRWTVEWPPLVGATSEDGETGEAAFERIVDELLAGRDAHLAPVFGELMQLRVV